MMTQIITVIFYSIIFENGASEYSVSDLATKELPEFEVTLRGAGLFFYISSQKLISLIVCRIIYS